MQRCDSQFFPTNTKRDLLMVAEQVLPGDRTLHFSSPQILPRWLQVQHRAEWRQSSRVLSPGTSWPTTPELRDGEE